MEKVPTLLAVMIIGIDHIKSTFHIPCADVCGKVLLPVIVIAATLLACSPATHRDNAEFAPLDNPVPDCPADFFDKKATIFDAVAICGTTGVRTDKLRHAAHVTAGWLDNDGDGQADEPALVSAIRSQPAILIMSAKGFTDEALEQIFEESEPGILQDLAANETNPADERDASQEEIHHLIVAAGWMKMRPDVFSDRRSEESRVYSEWRNAEAKGLYAYDDPTCDDACKTLEFFYLATAAYLGSAADLMSDEMRVKDRQALRETLPGVVTIIESPDYSYPLKAWPDGNYKPVGNIRFSGV